MVGTVVQAVAVVDVLWERVVLGGDVLAAVDEDSSVVVWSVVEFAVVRNSCWFGWMIESRCLKGGRYLSSYWWRTR
jgi:hypothetical protein